jgi:hypothetical protein
MESGSEQTTYGQDFDHDHDQPHGQQTHEKQGRPSPADLAA